MEGKLELLFSKLKNVSDVVLLVKSDGIGDLAIRSLIKLNDLVEVRMECLRDLSVVLLGLELLAEVEYFSCSIVIELKESGV